MRNSHRWKTLTRDIRARKGRKTQRRRRTRGVEREATPNLSNSPKKGEGEGLSVKSPGRRWVRGHNGDKKGGEESHPELMMKRGVNSQKTGSGVPRPPVGGGESWQKGRGDGSGRKEARKDGVGKKVSVPKEKAPGGSMRSGTSRVIWLVSKNSEFGLRSRGTGFQERNSGTFMGREKERLREIVLLDASLAILDRG